MNRRTIIIILVVLILITAGILLYFLFFRAGDAVTPSLLRKPRLVTPTPAQQTVAPGLKAISSFAVSSFGLTQDNSTVRFFERSTGNLYEANFDGTDVKKISDSILAQNLIKVIWSPKWDSFAALFTDETQNFLYNFNTGRSLFFKNDISALTFTPDGSQVIYQQNLPGGSSLMISGTNALVGRSLLEAVLPSLNLAPVPGTNLVSAWPAPSGLINSFLVLISPKGTVNQIFNDLTGLQVKWAPQGFVALISHFNNSLSQPALELTNNQGERKNLKVNTLADKCAWSASAKTIYCAVPDKWPDAAVQPDDYYKGITQPNDKIIKMDVATTLNNTVLDYAQIDAVELLLVPQEDYLLFINRKDGKLYSLKL